MYDAMKNVILFRTAVRPDDDGRQVSSLHVLHPKRPTRRDLEPPRCHRWLRVHSAIRAQSSGERVLHFTQGQLYPPEKFSF